MLQHCVCVCVNVSAYMNLDGCICLYVKKKKAYVDVCADTPVYLTVLSMSFWNKPNEGLLKREEQKCYYLASRLSAHMWNI